MPSAGNATQTLWQMVMSGGFVMYPLLFCSVAIWFVILERLWVYRKLGHALNSFHLEALNTLLRGDPDSLKVLCHRYPELPTSRLVGVALDRIGSKDPRVQAKWQEALERRRLMMNQELRQNLWILGTVASASPFIGLFGTVVGVLRSFQDIAKTGSGGFNVVAAGISESLIATAAGIVVAVVAVVAFNAFQTRWNGLVLTMKLQVEELAEMLEATRHPNPGMSRGPGGP